MLLSISVLLGQLSSYTTTEVVLDWAGFECSLEIQSWVWAATGCVPSSSSHLHIHQHHNNHKHHLPLNDGQASPFTSR
jgi:hypothetical protein